MSSTILNHPTDAEGKKKMATDVAKLPVANTGRTSGPGVAAYVPEAEESRNEENEALRLNVEEIRGVVKEPDDARISSPSPRQTKSNGEDGGKARNLMSPSSRGGGGSSPESSLRKAKPDSTGRISGSVTKAASLNSGRDEGSSTVKKTTSLSRQVSTDGGGSKSPTRLKANSGTLHHSK